MPVTRRSDIVIPELLIDAVRGEFTGARALYGSAAVTVHQSLPGGVKGGQKISIPYFATLGEAEDLQEGEALTPEGITASKEEAEVVHTGKAFAITEWAQMAGAGDPYAEAARQMRELFVRRWDKALIDVAATNVPSAYSLDLTGATDKTLGYDNMLSALQRWGDDQANVALIVCHSDVYFDILRKKDLNGLPLVSAPSRGPDGYKPAMWAGAAVVMSDKCSKTHVSANLYNYESFILKEKALVVWANGDISVDSDKDILVDARIVAAHHYFAAHRYLRVPGSAKPPVVKVKTQLNLAIA